MLDVNIDKILPVTEARDNFNKIVDEVEASDELYVLTKNGKPAAILVGVHHLEKLTGISHKRLMDDDMLGEDQPKEALPIVENNEAETVTTPSAESPIEKSSSDAFSAFAAPVSVGGMDATEAAPISEVEAPLTGVNPAIVPGPMPISSEPEEKPLTTPDWFTQPAITEPVAEAGSIPDSQANSSPMSDPPLEAAVEQSPVAPAPSAFGSFENPVQDDTSIPSTPITTDPVDSFSLPNPPASDPFPPVNNTSQQAVSPFPSDNTPQQTPPPPAGSF